jgi:hypothetical protein
MTDHRDPDTIPLSERIETAVSNHVLRACYIEMAKRLEALEERERARGGRPKKDAA